MGRGPGKARVSTAALHPGMEEETAPPVIDWQDSQATICWLEMIDNQHPRGTILLWIDNAGHHTSDEVEEWPEGASSF